jgi:hypothetical protein
VRRGADAVRYGLQGLIIIITIIIIIIIKPTAMQHTHNISQPLEAEGVHRSRCHHQQRFLCNLGLLGVTTSQ